MDIKSLSELLKGTLDPSHRNEAEKKLTEIHKIIGFGPVLLQVMIDHVVSSHDDDATCAAAGHHVGRGGAAGQTGRRHLPEEHGERQLGGAGARHARPAHPLLRARAGQGPHQVRPADIF